MSKSIAIIGYGTVGKACHKQFEHNMVCYMVDPKYNILTIEDLKDLNPEIVFVAVNAPTLDDRSIDSGAIYTIFQQLVDIQYSGIVILKSTLTPDIVTDLYEKFGSNEDLNKIGPLRYIYSPEFLREKEWEKDAISPRQIILSGSYIDCQVVEAIYKKHSHVDSHTKFQYLSYGETAFVKYAINCFLATKVVFMNQLYQLYSDMNNSVPYLGLWEYMVDVLTYDLRLGYTHNSVPGEDGKFGYGGSCFPKDMSAFIGYDKNGRLSLIRDAELANTKIRLTKSIQE